MRIIAYLIVILFPLVIVFGNFNYLIFNKSFYQNLYQKSGTYQNLDREIVDNKTDNLFGYYRGKNELDHNFFSDQTRSHLADVKNLLIFSQNFLLVSVLTTLILSAPLIFKRKVKVLANSLFFASVITIIIMILLSFGMLNAFDSFFLKFHQVLFKNDLWQFPPDDNLIKLFPVQFFYFFAQRLFVNILIFSIIIALGSKLILLIKK